MDRTEITFELLMEKFTFHHNIVTFHANMARIAGEHIKENYEDEAKASGKFLPEFFEEENTADGVSSVNDEATADKE